MLSQPSQCSSSLGPPSCGLQQWLSEIFHRVADAEVGYGYDVVRDAENLPQLGHLEHADPSHADTFSTGRQPHILHCAAGRVHVGLPDRVPPKYLFCSG